MQNALTKVDEYDVFIIDEADACFMELGTVQDILNERIYGFWGLAFKENCPNDRINQLKL